MPLSDTNLVYKSSIISKAFFWMDIENNATPHKKFRVFLYPEQLVIGSHDNTNVSFNTSIDTPTASFKEEHTLPIKELNKILIIKNSNLFCRIYFFTNSGVKVKINLFNTEADELISHLKPLLTKKTSIQRTSLDNEKFKKRFKIWIIIGLTLVIAAILAYYTVSFFLPHSVVNSFYAAR